MILYPILFLFPPSPIELQYNKHFLPTSPKKNKKTDPENNLIFFFRPQLKEKRKINIPPRKKSRIVIHIHLPLQLPHPPFPPSPPPFSPPPPSFPIKKPIMAMKAQNRDGMVRSVGVMFSFLWFVAKRKRCLFGRLFFGLC